MLYAAYGEQFYGLGAARSLRVAPFNPTCCLTNPMPFPP